MQVWPTFHELNHDVDYSNRHMIVIKGTISYQTYAKSQRCEFNEVASTHGVKRAVWRASPFTHPCGHNCRMVKCSRSRSSRRSSSSKQASNTYTSSSSSTKCNDAITANTTPTPTNNIMATNTARPPPLESDECKVTSTTITIAVAITITTNSVNDSNTNTSKR